MKTRFLVIIGGAVAIAIVSIFIYDGIMLDEICKNDGGRRVGEICQIPIMTNSTTSQPNPAKITTMKPDSMIFFYYPSKQLSEKPEAYETFMLIRLPEWLGGAANDTSAFRAYSAKSLDDSCLVKYWPNPERQQIENPCSGGMYRVTDGMLYSSSNPLNVKMVALPHLDLSIDENGILYIETPKWTKTENGVIGYGRELSIDDINKGSQYLIDSFAKLYPDSPKIPLTFAGFTMSDIQDTSYGANVSYTDLTSSLIHVQIKIQKIGFGTNILPRDSSEKWMVGTTPIYIGGTALDKDNNSKYKYYTVEFSKDKYNFRITGQDIDEIKKAIVSSFFPETLLKMRS